MSDIMSYLFKTNAIKFCEENKPFWYTSGKIGPYFINTHFVYGSEKEASDLLKSIIQKYKDEPKDKRPSVYTGAMLEYAKIQLKNIPSSSYIFFNIFSNNILITRRC